MKYADYRIEQNVPKDHRGLTLKPFAGIGMSRPPDRSTGKLLKSCADFDPSGNKQASDLKSALWKAGIRNGMVVSTHHHLRNGDRVAEQLFAAASELGIKDLIWFPSAVFPCHESLLPYLEDGTIHHIQGSLNGPVGDFASQGKMRDLAILRSHGSRYRAIQDGEICVDIAMIAAPSCDQFGNMTGAIGPSACGVLGFAVADAEYANHVISITDNLVPFPCAPWQIAGNHVDQVVVVDSIGDAAGIVSGTTQITRSPERQVIAEHAVQFAIVAGIMKEGWSFQAGAGGTSLAFTAYAAREMKSRGIRASFVRGGSTAVAVEMLETGQTGFLLDGQTFDLEGVRSVRENQNHIMTSPFNSYNYHGKGNIASILDCAVLGATEIDLDFNANVVTHSDGRLLHGIGGWQDALFSKCTILAVPSMRNRVPMIRERLTTFCGPGELIDVVVTELGIAVNPLRKDLLEAVSSSNLPIVTLNEIKDRTEKLAGGPPKPASQDGPIIGLVTWVDGTIIDVVRQFQI
jgi:citrate lyase subunit alpha/citrate CoA-transferase